MKSLTRAINEFISAQFIAATKPRLCWFPELGYKVTWYFSDETIKRMGGEVVLK